MKKSEVTYKYNWTAGTYFEEQMFEILHRNTDTPEEMEKWQSLIESLKRTYIAM